MPFNGLWSGAGFHDVGQFQLVPFSHVQLVVFGFGDSNKVLYVVIAFVVVNVMDVVTFGDGAVVLLPYIGV